MISPITRYLRVFSLSESPIGKEGLKKKDIDPSFINERISISLVNILKKISVSTSFEDVFLSISKLIVEEIENVGSVAFYLVDREIEMIQCLGKATKDSTFIPGNPNIEIIQDFFRGILGVTAQTGLPTRASDLQREDFTGSEICIPIKFENETFGLIWVEKPITLDFSAEEEKRLVHISNAFGGFIKSKLLTRRLQRSELKLHEKNLELQDSTQFQEEIMSSMNEGLVIIDENLHIVSLNKKAEEELGYEAAELINRSYVTIVADSSFFKVHEEIKKQKSEELSSSFRARFLHKDSIEIPVLIHAAPYYSEGAYKGVIILFTNLSKFIEVEEEILWLRGFRQRILDALPIGIVGISNDQRINYINDYFQTHIKLPGESTILGKSLDHVFSESVLGSAYSSVLLALEEGILDQKGLRINEVKFNIGDNKYIMNLSLIPLFNYSDEFVGAILVFDDDTAIYTLVNRLRKAYKELEERQDRLVREVQQRTEFQKKLIEVTKELRQKHLEMENFVYSISHDLKTPIVSIQGFIAALTEDLTPKLKDSEINFYIDRIGKNTAYAKQLIIDILEYSQLGQDTPVETIDSSELLQLAIEQIESQIDYTNFEVIVESHSYPRIQCQEKRILQVFVNLISNAWKYRDTSKKKSFLRISMEEDDKFWIFLFKDNGLGIPDSHRERIFNMFERVHSNSRDSIDGSGVGLAFVKKIVEIHNGRITVDSEVNEGSTFRVWLPKKPSIQRDRLF